MKDPGTGNPPKLAKNGHTNSGTFGSDPNKQQRAGTAAPVSPKG
jgi:hypothetical protein